jgi:hypothetical protein
MRTVLPIVYASVVGLLLGCSDSTGPSEPPSIISPPQVPTFPAGASQVSPATPIAKKPISPPCRGKC